MSILLDVNWQRSGFQLALATALPSEGVVGIYGPSGSGKTSLLRWIAGLEPQVGGELHFRQQIWQDRHQLLPSWQRKLAYVFQEPRLFPHLDVEGNLLFAYKRRAAVAKPKSAATQSRATNTAPQTNDGPSLNQVCQWLDIQHLRQHMPAQLSGGQQQRVAIARALLSQPQLLLFDEPLSALDKPSRLKILSLLQTLKQHIDCPMLYVSHDIEELAGIADQLLLLDQGRIQAQGDMIDLCSRVDLALSHEEQAASIISASIKQHDSRYSLSEVLVDESHSLFLSQLDSSVGDQLRIRIPARDVSLSLSPAMDSSILNILPCTIDSIEDTHAAHVLVRLRCGEHFLLARLTQKSVHRLALSCGQAVYAQIKSVALLQKSSHPTSSDHNQDN